jgi:hypothetical protein
MPRVKVLHLLSMAPPRVGTAYAYLSWFAPIVKLDQLPGKTRDEPCERGIIIVPASTRLTT